MRIISYSLDEERDYGFMVTDEEFVPRSFVENVIGLSLPSDVKALLPDRELIQLIESALGGIQIEKIPIESVHIEPPIPNPGKIICLGLNYLDHAEESGQFAQQDQLLPSGHLEADVPWQPRPWDWPLPG